MEYVGIDRGTDDMGRDLICRYRGSVFIVQCKNWEDHNPVGPKDMLYLAGSASYYSLENPTDHVTGGILYNNSFLLLC